MLRSAARSAFASRGRFVLTGAAIMLSVAFLVATMVLIIGYETGLVSPGE